MKGKDGIIDANETTGENSGPNAFRYEVWPNVCGVVVDTGSEKGFVQITGGELADQVIQTGYGKSDVVMADIQPDQTCMIYGSSTVLYIRPSN